MKTIGYIGHGGSPMQTLRKLINENMNYIKLDYVELKPTLPIDVKHIKYDSDFTIEPFNNLISKKRYTSSIGYFDKYLK